MFRWTTTAILFTATVAAGSGLPPGPDLYTGETPEVAPTELPDYTGKGAVDVKLQYKIAGVAETEKPAVIEELLPILKIRAAGLAKKSKVERGSALGNVDVSLIECNDPERARDVLESRAVLEFRAVAESPTLTEIIAEEGSGGIGYTVDERGYIRFDETDWSAFQSNVSGIELPDGYTIAYTQPVTGKVGALLLTDDGMVVDEVKDAVFADDPVGGPMVTFDLDLAGRQEFAGLTARHVGGELAILFDGFIMYKGQVAERIEGLANIENVTTREEAEDIALLLRSGALPARLELMKWYINGVETNVSSK